ncbi:MAG: DUF1566 domain-containing protein [Planctomycetes bacterium]|nr:DUF1566 domain-containing protein [Planctomycetota bacterium]
MKCVNHFTLIGFAALVWIVAGTAAANDFSVVDTGQKKCFDDADEISFPAAGQAFYGQDAPYLGHPPSYEISGDGLTVYDYRTGLTWIRTPDTNNDGDLDSDDKLSWTQFVSYAATLNAQSYGGYNDWRQPTIKELYSLIDFSGIDPSGYTGGISGLVPFIDTDYFDFAYGDESAGERIIDAQYWSSTQYVGTIFMGDAGVFGVNFADGRIKCYPRDNGPGGTMTQFARFVRGNTSYGVNDFVNNGNGTITDNATGLMWMQSDSGTAYDWEEALDYAENLEYADHDDWRLPNAKELQSIVDYTRSPTTTGSPAINPIFNTSSIIDETGGTNYPFFWTGTTHINWTDDPGGFACYVAFGQGWGYFGPPGMEQWMDVHGAGCQRSDPKAGDPDDWPTGHGPQGDAIRIYNHVRCVRGGISTALQGSAYTLSAGSASSIDLALDAGVAHAGRDYYLLGGISGIDPGHTFGTGITLPLNPDLFTDMIFQLVNTSVFLNFLGTLDGNGTQTAALNTLGALPSEMVGVTLYFAYVTFNPIDFASNPIAVKIEE